MVTFIPTYAAQRDRAKFPLPITDRLPFISINVGERVTGKPLKSHPSLEGIADSASGVNLGRLQYFLDVRQKYPDWFQAFGEMTPEIYDSLRVGGIDNFSKGAECTHYATLHTPMFVNGMAITISFALTDSLPCNLIWGLPFMIKAKMVLSLAEKYVYSETFRTTYPIEYKIPQMEDDIAGPDEVTPVFGVSMSE
jgi:hypothetical protein